MSFSYLCGEIQKVRLRALCLKLNYTDHNPNHTNLYRIPTFYDPLTKQYKECS